MSCIGSVKNLLITTLVVSSALNLWSNQEPCEKLCKTLAREMDEDSNAADLKKKFKAFALHCHPDKCPSPDTQKIFREIAAKYNKIINQAPPLWFANEENKFDNSDWIDQTSDKIDELQRKLKKLVNKPGEPRIQKKVLNLYNSLRKELGYNLVSSASEINNKWLVNLSNEILFLDLLGTRTEAAIDTISEIRTRLAENMKSSNDDQQKINQILEDYNQLRHQFQLPLVKAVDDIDYSWLQTIGCIQPDNQTHDSFNIADKFGVKHATISQDHLVHETQKKLNIKGKILVASHGDEETILGYAIPHIHPKVHYLEIGNCPDLDNMLFTIYHELGHIVHNDNIDNIWTSNSEPRKVLSELLQKPDLIKDIQRINRYIELGNKAFNATSAIGRQVNECLTRKVPAYESYENLSIEKEFMLVEERRADLFALDNLLEHNHIAAILQSIQFFLHEFVTYESVFGLPSPDLDPHPSSLERILYIAGFLVEKGINLNNELKKFEQSGTCIDYHSIYDKELPNKQYQLRNAVKKAYELARHQYEAQISL